MNKNTVSLIILSVLVALAWIGYTVVSNIVAPSTATADTYSRYTKLIPNQMYISAFKKLTNTQGSVKYNLSDLSPTPTITPSVTPQ